MRRWEIALILPMYAILLFMAVESTYLWQTYDSYYARPAITGFLSMLAFSIPVYLRFSGRMIVPWPLLILIYMAVTLHTWGDYALWYDQYLWWDNVTHFVSASAVGILSFLTILLINHYVSAVHIPRRLMPFMVVMFTAFFGVVWEMTEWVLDYLTGTGMQYSLQDTVNDLVMDLIGGTVIGIAGHFYLKRKDPDELAISLGLGDFMRRLALRWDRRAGILK